VGTRAGTDTDKNLVGPTAEMDMEITIEISVIFPFSDRSANTLVTTRTELPGIRKAIASRALSHVMSVRKERPQTDEICGIPKLGLLPTSVKTCQSG
jgi:hypothetical protein